MNPSHAIIILMISLCCTSCAFIPKIASEQPYTNECDMSTKKLTLDKPRSTQVINCQQSMHSPHDLLGCLIIAGIIVPAGSFMVSGSVVLVNNSIHWLEYQGRCNKNKKNVEVKKKDDPLK